VGQVALTNWRPAASSLTSVVSVISNTILVGSAPVRSIACAMKSIRAGSPSDAAEMFSSTARPVATISAERAITQRSMSAMKPYSSTAGRNEPGPRTPSPFGSRIRISRSRWTVSPPARSMIGCA
jgi:hypothetical protein